MSASNTEKQKLPPEPDYFDGMDDACPGLDDLGDFTHHEPQGSPPSTNKGPVTYAGSLLDDCKAVSILRSENINTDVNDLFNKVFKETP